MNVINVYKLYDDIEIPKLQTKNSACFDIPALISEKEQVLSYSKQNTNIQKDIHFDETKKKNFIKISSFERILIPTGLIFSFDCIYSLRLHSRSGLSVKKGLVLANQEGIIDCDYNKQLYVCLMNVTDVQQRIYDKDRISQAELVVNIHELDEITIQETETKPGKTTDRDGGFGSTGV